MRSRTGPSSHGWLISVIDLQGMTDPEKDRYVLTDPAIHHEGLSKFFNSGLNLGAVQITSRFTTFMDNLVCNIVCDTLTIHAFNESAIVDKLRALDVALHSNSFEGGLFKFFVNGF